MHRSLPYKICYDPKLLLGSGAQGPYTLKFPNFFEASLLIFHQRLGPQSGKMGRGKVKSTHTSTYFCHLLSNIFVSDSDLVLGNDKRGQGGKEENVASY